MTAHSSAAVAELAVESHGAAMTALAQCSAAVVEPPVDTHGATYGDAKAALAQCLSTVIESAVDTHGATCGDAKAALDQCSSAVIEPAMETHETKHGAAMVALVHCSSAVVEPAVETHEAVMAVLAPVSVPIVPQPALRNAPAFLAKLNNFRRKGGSIDVVAAKLQAQFEDSPSPASQEAADMGWLVAFAGDDPDFFDDE